MNKLIVWIAVIGTVTNVQAFYYQQYETPLVAPMLYAESNIYPTLEQYAHSDNMNAYREWQGSNNPVPLHFHHALQMEEPQPSATEDVCQSGFVEYCLIQANQDGEQRLLAAENRTGDHQDEQMLAREFDGMCHVVVRFIDCINHHYIRCTPAQSVNQLANVKDVFYQSWNQLCSTDGPVRRKYLQHANCIKNALTYNHGQEQCQARFQGYFMSGQFSLDSVENAVQYGCCAFNEWQYCIDNLIIRECGHDAMKSVQDLIEQASGGLVSSLCDKKVFGRKTKACIGKKNYTYHKLNSLDPKLNATLHKYISIFGDFIDRLPDDDESN